MKSAPRKLSQNRAKDGVSDIGSITRGYSAFGPLPKPFHLFSLRQAGRGAARIRAGDRFRAAQPGCHAQGERGWEYHGTLKPAGGWSDRAVTLG
jgi:hypothetical protein